jgi:hypothetical protein
VGADESKGVAIANKRYTAFNILLLLVAALVTLLYLAFSPDYWAFSTDDAVYLASAQSLIADNAYQLNQLPNLLVYPGTSLLILLPLKFCGLSFYCLHLVFTAVAVCALVVVYALFRRGGGVSSLNSMIALSVVIVFGLNDYFMSHVYYLRSDHFFIFLSLLAILLYTKYLSGGERKWLVVTLIVVAYTPLVRFQGLFVCLAFVVATAIDSEGRLGVRLFRSSSLLLLVTMPFALWTLRNYINYTPDAYNMALAHFFSLSGPLMYAPSAEMDTEHPTFVYVFTRMLFVAKALYYSSLPTSLIGEEGSIRFTLVMALSLFLFFLGLPRWVKHSGTMEKSYFYISFGYLVYSSILRFADPASMVVVMRYWLPVMPFLFLIIGNGVVVAADVIRQSCHLESRSVWLAKHIPGMLMLLLLVLPIQSGIQRLTSYGSQQWDAYWTERNEALQEVEAYLRDNADNSTYIAGTDWGLIPYISPARVITLVNDIELSLERVKKYKPEYLVVVLPAYSGIRPYNLEKNSNPSRHNMYQTLMQLMERYPRAFKRVVRPDINEKMNWIAVYSIDYRELENRAVVR